MLTLSLPLSFSRSLPLSLSCRRQASLEEKHNAAAKLAGKTADEVPAAPAKRVEQASPADERPHAALRSPSPEGCTLCSAGAASWLEEVDGEEGESGVAREASPGLGEQVRRGVQRAVAAAISPGAVLIGVAARLVLASKEDEFLEDQRAGWGKRGQGKRRGRLQGEDAQGGVGGDRDGGGFRQRVHAAHDERGGFRQRVQAAHDERAAAAAAFLSPSELFLFPTMAF